MKTSRDQLKNLLLKNVLEIKFVRRRPIFGHPGTRRMLCTVCFELLNSPNGLLTLNFRPTYRPPRYNPNQKNLLVAWDIFMQDYRNINCDSVEVVSVIPADDKFWEYFANHLQPLTPEQKMEFQDR